MQSLRPHESPYPRRSCPRCKKVIAENEVWCPYCGVDTRPAKRLSNGCVVATIVVIGYPVLAFGFFLVLAMADTAVSLPGLLAPVFIFLLPLLLVVLLSWAATRNRTP
jgi:hypothetical protein